MNQALTLFEATFLAAMLLPPAVAPVSGGEPPKAKEEQASPAGQGSAGGKEKKQPSASPARLTPRERLRRELERIRRERIERIRQPPLPGPQRLVSFGIDCYPAYWCGLAGEGLNAPTYQEAYGTGIGTRLRIGLSVLPAIEFGCLFGVEHQEGRRVAIRDLPSWTVEFQDRTMFSMLLEARVAWPVGLHHWKLLSPEWTCRREGLVPYIVPVRLGMLYHPDVDVSVDGLPPPSPRGRTGYYLPGPLWLYEFALGIEYRTHSYGLFLEWGARTTGAPRKDPGSFLTNRSDRMVSGDVAPFLWASLGVTVRF